MGKISLLAVACSVLMTTQAFGQSAGWRTDGTGVYPQAQPPLHWAKDKNIVWASKMPSWSNASPILVGQRIFVCSEPATLLCASTKDGAILWQKTNTYADVFGPDANAKSEQAREIKKELGKLETDLRTAQKAVKDAATQPAADTTGLKDQVKQLQQQVEERRTQLKPLEDFLAPATNETGGYSSFTPVSNGRNVYVVTGLGTVGCYDLEGNRQWIRFLENQYPHPYAGLGVSSSPVLAGGKLLVHLGNLFALDPNTGATIWKAKVAPAYGTAAVAKIGSQDVAVLPSGCLVSLSDGNVLATKLWDIIPDSRCCSPIVAGNIVYFITDAGKAIRLPAQVKTDVPVAPEILWQCQPKKDRYFASPVLHDGCIYTVSWKGTLSVIDANTGEVLAERDLKPGSDTYSSLCLAGKYLLTSGEKGTTIVMQLGKDAPEVARNTLEPFRSTPVFEGTRMYIRGSENLYCVEESGK